MAAHLLGVTHNAAPIRLLSGKISQSLPLVTSLHFLAASWLDFSFRSFPTQLFPPFCSLVGSLGSL